MHVSDLVSKQANERQASEAGDVVGSNSAIARLVIGTTGACRTIATALLRQLGTSPGRCLRFVGLQSSANRRRI